MPRKPLLPLIAALLLIGCAGATTEPESPGASVDDLFAEYYQFKLRVNPVEATKAGETGYRRLRGQLHSRPRYQASLIGEYEGFLAEIASFETADLSAADRTSLAVMKWDCEIKKEGLENPLATVASPMFDLPDIQLMPVSQFSSFNLYFSQLAGGESIQPFDMVEDYENWLERLEDYVEWIDTAIANMRTGMERGVVVWPRAIVERSLGQIDELIESEIESHLYYRPIELLPESFAPEDAERLAADFEQAILEKLNPAHQRLWDFMKNEYLPVAGDHTGIGALPDGPEAYDYLVRFHTTTTMTAEEIHTLGLQEVERISREMEAIKESVGFEGDLRAFLDHVRASPEQTPFTEPEQVIANFEAIHERMKSQIGEVFDVEPKAGFEVRRTEAFREASASAEYVPGTKDGARPGVFYVPIPDVKAYNKYADEALFLHEGDSWTSLPTLIAARERGTARVPSPRIDGCLRRGLGALQ